MAHMWEAVEYQAEDYDMIFLRTPDHCLLKLHYNFFQEFFVRYGVKYSLPNLAGFLWMTLSILQWSAQN